MSLSVTLHLPFGFTNFDTPALLRSSSIPSIHLFNGLPLDLSPLDDDVAWVLGLQGHVTVINSHAVVNAMIAFLDRRAVRPSKKLSLQSTAERWQWWPSPNWLLTDYSTQMQQPPGTIYPCPKMCQCWVLWNYVQYFSRHCADNIPDAQTDRNGHVNSPKTLCVRPHHTSGGTKNNNSHTTLKQSRITSTANNIQK